MCEWSKLLFFNSSFVKPFERIRAFHIEPYTALAPPLIAACNEAKLPTSANISEFIIF